MGQNFVTRLLKPVRKLVQPLLPVVQRIWAPVAAVGNKLPDFAGAQRSVARDLGGCALALKKKAQDEPLHRSVVLYVRAYLLALASVAIHFYVANGVSALPLALLKAALFVVGVLGIGIATGTLLLLVAAALIATVGLALTKGRKALEDMQPEEEPVLRSWREIVHRAYSALRRRPPLG
ncbi:hypothetical protein BXU09_17680 [Deinococcus sp. LM3]|nr:hypothetical protein BXU09_17680 [Deinococcus sp. LM3]